MTVPHEFVPGLYGKAFCIYPQIGRLTDIPGADLVVEEVVGDDSIIYTGEVTDLELLSQS